MKESAIVTAIIKALRDRYPRVYCRKLADRFQRGLPDIIVVCPCRQPGLALEGSFFLGIECKTKVGRPTPLQRIEGEAINKIPGAYWMVARSVEEVMSVMESNGAVA